MEVFKELVKREPDLLARPMEELVPISFIGDAAVAAYRTIIGQLKRMDQLDEQNKKTLSDGQDAGKMQLLIQAAIGGKLREEIADNGGGLSTEERRELSKSTKMTHRQRTTARTISKHPEAIEEVIQEAEENEDIPTKTAVINKIAYKEEKKVKDQVERNESIMDDDARKYLSAVRHAYRLIADPPKSISEDAFSAIRKELILLKTKIEAILG